MTALAITGVGLLAPGLAGWAASQAVLSGVRSYSAEPLPTAMAAWLPANERRRTTRTVKLALQVAQEALAMAALPATTVSAVFASSAGDSEVIDQICTALIQPDRPVSPTHFHHSVHNTPAGYWAIATGCRQSSLSLSAYDGSFVVGLREAAALAWAEASPVLLVAYDLPPLFPLAEHRPLLAPFAVALLLAPTAPTAGALGVMQLLPVTHEAVRPLADPALECLHAGNPAARSLPLLCAMAQRQAGIVTLAAGDEQPLSVVFTP